LGEEVKVSGPFERQEVVDRFKDDDYVDDTGKIVYKSAEIQLATPACVIYDDGFHLWHPLEPAVLDHEAYLKLMGYMDKATQLNLAAIQESDDPLSAAVGEALDIWDNDLNHRFGEWERPKKLGKPNPKFDAAAEYALANKKESLVKVSEKFKVNYHKFVNDLRNRHFRVDAATSQWYNDGSEVE
jgi:hypothetical protein